MTEQPLRIPSEALERQGHMIELPGPLSVSAVPTTGSVAAHAVVLDAKSNFRTHQCRPTAPGSCSRESGKLTDVEHMHCFRNAVTVLKRSRWMKQR